MSLPVGPGDPVCDPAWGNIKVRGLPVDIAGIICGSAAASALSDSSKRGSALNVSDDEVLFSGPTLNSSAVFNASTPLYNDTSLGSLKAWPPLPASFAIPNIPGARMTFQQFSHTRQTAGSGAELVALQNFISWTKQQLVPFQWEYDPIELQAYDLQERLYFQIIPPDGDGKTFKYPDWGVPILDRYFALMSHFGIRGSYASVWLDMCQCIIAKIALIPNFTPAPAAKRHFPVPYNLPSIAPIVGLQDGMLELTSRRFAFTPDEQHSFAQAVLETQYILDHEYPIDTPMPATLTRSISDQGWTFHFTRAVLVAHPPIDYGQVIVVLGTVARYGSLYEAIDRCHVWMGGLDYGELRFTQDGAQLSNGNVSSVSNISDASSAGLVATT